MDKSRVVSSRFDRGICGLAALAILFVSPALSDTCSDSQSGSCWNYLNVQDGYTRLLLSYDSARGLRKFLTESKNVGQTSAEIASLDAIISYGSVSPLEIRLTPEENTSVNLSCSIFTSEGEEVGNFFSQRWFSGAKHCGDIKHTLALHLNYFLGIELSSLRTIGGAGTKLAWLQDLDKYNSMAFAGKVNLDESAWVDFAIEAQRSGYAFDSVEEKLPIAILDHLKSGKLVDTDTFQVIGAVVQRDEGFPNEFFGIPKNEPVLMHSAERSVDWEEAWGDGKLAFVSVQDDAILYGKEDAFTRDSLVAQREAFADFNRFLSYTYIDYSTVFRTGQ